MSRMKGLLRTKETKTHIYKCQKNQGHGRSCRQPTSLDGSASPESGPRAGRVEEDIGEKIVAWRRVDHCLMSRFLPTGRSCLGAHGGGVASRRWRSRQKNFRQPR